MQFPVQYLIEKTSWAATPDDGSVMDRADDGSPHVRRLWATTRYAITFDVVNLSATDVAEIRQFYRDTRLTTVEFADPITGEMMEAIMLREPEVTAVVGTMHTMRVQLDAKYL